jgi:transposase InsO family protein
MAIDILGPLPLTERGNKYVLVCADYFTKWVECIPMKNQEAETIAEALVEQVFSRFGIPHELHSDQGKNFEGRVMHSVCERLGIHKTRTTPYHPQSDGMVERFNRSLCDALSKILEKEHDWDMLVPYVCMQYRASTHKATGCTPALLMFGRELRLPLDVIYPPVMPSIYLDTEEYLDQLEDKIAKAATFARKSLDTQFEVREKHCANHSRKTFELDIQRPVYVFNPSVGRGKSPKFARCWKGPYRILEQVTDLLYRIDFPGRNQSKVVHRSHISQPSN